MKFFMMSKCGEGFGLLEQIKLEGNQVRAYISEEDYYSVYDGIIKKEKTCNPTKDEIVIFDSSGHGKEADEYRKSGNLVFGASKFHDRLECDREFGLDFMKKAGIKIPEYYRFKDFKKARDFANHSEDERFVFKPSGKTIPSKLTYVADDRDDLICYLDFVEKYFAKDIDDFILQCFVEGAVVSSEFWCGPTGFVRPGNQTVEVKKFMNDNLGPSTGCQGNLVWICDEGKILKQGICKAENALIDNGYIGPIDLNAIVNEEGVYGLEWTPRFGLDAMPTLLQLLTMDVGELVSNLVKGQLHEFPADDSFAGGVRVSIPPYPIEPISTKGTYEVQKNSPNFGVPLRFPERFEDNYYFYEIVSENGDLYHSDGTGIIAVISAAREECEESIKACYDIIEEVKIPDIQYRTDLAEVLPDMYEEVKEQELCLT